MNHRMGVTVTKRAHSFAPYLLLTVYSAFVFASCVEGDWRPEWDGAIDLLAARSIAEDEGRSHLDRPFIPRPPGLSRDPSRFVRDGSFDFRVPNHAIAACRDGTVRVRLLLRGRDGGRGCATAVARLASTSPLLVVRVNGIQSEWESSC